MADFSLDLNEDQLQIQKWVHDFAENVIRPVARGVRREEETPWPIIEEAANIGLYSQEVDDHASSPTRPGSPSRSSARSWPGADAGIALAIFGTTLGVSGIVGSGTPEQIAEWVPQCFGTPDDIHLAAFAVSEPDAGSRREQPAHAGRLRRGQGRVGDQRHQDLDHQRRHRQGPERARGRRVGRARAQGARSRELRRPAGHARACSMGQKFKKMGIRASHTAEVILDDVRVPGSLPARRQGEARRRASPAPVRARAPACRPR